MWNFKGYLWNSTQNILPIHWTCWKMCILSTYDNLRALRIKSSYAFLKHPPDDLEMPCMIKILATNVAPYWIADEISDCVTVSDYSAAWLASKGFPIVIPGGPRDWLYTGWLWCQIWKDNSLTHCGLVMPCGTNGRWNRIKKALFNVTFKTDHSTYNRQYMIAKICLGQHWFR